MTQNPALDDKLCHFADVSSQIGLKSYLEQSDMNVFIAIIKNCVTVSQSTLTEHIMDNQHCLSAACAV